MLYHRYEYKKLTVGNQVFLKNLIHKMFGLKTSNAYKKARNTSGQEHALQMNVVTPISDVDLCRLQRWFILLYLIHALRS